MPRSLHLPKTFALYLTILFIRIHSIENTKHRLFYHYKPNDAKHEFSYNYSESDIDEIKKRCVDKSILMFDMSYRPEELLIELLKEFKSYIKKHNEELLSDILISHPFDGLKKLNTDY